MSSYKNLVIIPPFQSRVALTENLQNRQSLAVSLAPRYSIANMPFAFNLKPLNRFHLVHNEHYIINYIN
jgi:hypothetical protein